MSSGRADLEGQLSEVVLADLAVRGRRVFEAVHTSELDVEGPPADQAIEAVERLAGGRAVQMGSG